MSVFTWTLPVIMTPAGLQPQAPINLYNQLQNNAAAASPGYTGRLPGSLIEDVSSTSVAAVSLCDQAKVDLVNSLTPYGANLFVLNQLAQCYGVTPIGSVGNIVTYVKFTGSSANVGQVVPAGTSCSGGGVTFLTQQDTIIPSTPFVTALVPAVSTNNLVATVAANAVNTTAFVPSAGTISVTNPSAGTQSTAETYYAFRQRVFQAGLAAATSTGRFIKTAVQGQPSVPTMSVQPGKTATGSTPLDVVGGYRIVVGGSYDPYQTALAIFNSIADPTRLLGSAVSTARNVNISVVDYPDTWGITYVAAITQLVLITITWNTTLASFASGAAFPQLVAPPIAAYISSLGVGQAINGLALREIFLETVGTLIDPSYIDALNFTVTIAGNVVTPVGDLSTYAGDPEGYFLCQQSNITVVQG